MRAAWASTWTVAEAARAMNLLYMLGLCPCARCGRNIQRRAWGAHLLRCAQLGGEG